MIFRHMRTAAMAVTCAIVLISMSTASPAAPFDGEWNFLVTTKDHCGNSHWHFKIVEGQIYNPYLMFVGGFPARVSGQVSATGQVTINVLAGPRAATGTGTLGKALGNGKWDGRGPSGTCAGAWKASRSS